MLFVICNIFPTQNKDYLLTYLGMKNAEMISAWPFPESKDVPLSVMTSIALTSTVRVFNHMCMHFRGQDLTYNNFYFEYKIKGSNCAPYDWPI